MKEKNQSYRIGIEVSGAKSILTLGKSFTTLNPDFFFFSPAGLEEAGVDPRFAGLVEEENVSLAGKVGDDVVILCELFLAVKDLLSSPESWVGDMYLSRIWSMMRNNDRHVNYCFHWLSSLKDHSD